MTDKQKNYVGYSSLLTGIVIVLLLLLYFLPTEWIDKYNLRQIDILSDIRIKNDTTLLNSDLIEVTKPPFIDTCKAGMTCFEDFSPKQNGMDAFYEALSNVKKLKRPVRVGFLGDSFIEGDIFCGDLREKLQTKYGGKGVGMMPLGSNTSSFRQTVIHRFSGWESHSLVDTNNPKRYDLLGIGGTAFIPVNDANVYYAGVKKIANLDTCNRVSLFYSLPSGKSYISYSLNKGVRESVTLNASTGVQRLDLPLQKIGEVAISFQANPRLVLYGVSLEDTTGILVDNFSLRGNSGYPLRSIPEKTLRDMDSLTHYDLIILQYGLNVMEAKKTNFSGVKNEMVKTVKYFQNCFPSSSFLLIGVPDRSTKKNGEYVSMSSIPYLIAAQKEICAETGIVFWDLFEAMGGENSMVSFVNDKPPKANKDYTHLTFKGGEYLGDILYQTIVYQKERYEKKKAYYK